MSRHGRERLITPSASSATPRMRWSPRSAGRANTASTSSRWRTAARASRRCWRKTRSQPWWARRTAATCASAFIRVAPALPAPPPRPASTGSFMPISPPSATSRRWPRVARRSPTATFLAVVVELGQTVKAEQVQLDINRMKRHFDLLCELMHKARKLGIKLLVGTDTGNNSFTPYGELHAKELEIFVKHGGYAPM